jgi:hypothetical protein
MHWSWRRSLLPAGLDALAEGSLVLVIYVALVNVPPGGQLPLGLVEYLLAAAVGVALVRSTQRGMGRFLVLGAAVLGAGCLGWLADPLARATLLARGLGPALAIGLPGWLLGISVLRGAAHEDPAVDASVTSRVLTLGVPLVALPWLTHAGEPSGAPFVGPALVGSLLFVSSALLAIAHGRLAALGLDPGESRGGRTWNAVVVAVVALLGLAGVIAAFALGAPLAVLVSVVGGSVLAAVATGIGALLPWLTPVGSVLSGLLGRVSGLPSPGHGATSVPLIPSGGGVAASGPPAWAAALVLLGVLMGLALLVRYRRIFQGPGLPRPPGSDRERRMMVAPHLGVNVGIPHLRAAVPRLPHSPADAVEAYVQLQRDLARYPDLERRESESPGAHAARIGGGAVPAAPLALLVADFELAVYGSRTLSRHEHRRGVGRWRRIRRALRSRRGGAGAGGAGAAG